VETIYRGIAVGEPPRPVDEHACNARPLQDVLSSVLIVEDSSEARALLAALLARRGFCVEAVASAREALDVLKRDDAPRIALVDWVMPGLTGRELVEVLRRRPAERYVYCIMMTAFFSEKSIRRAYRAGVDEFLTKPMSLSRVVTSIVRGQQLLDEERAPGVDVRQAS
jgi:two-component system, cell cycle response regulator